MILVLKKCALYGIKFSIFNILLRNDIDVIFNNYLVEIRDLYIGLSKKPSSPTLATYCQLFKWITYSCDFYECYLLAR